MVGKGRNGDAVDSGDVGVGLGRMSMVSIYKLFIAKR